MSDSFDLLVVGAGMAGTAAANKCAARGWRVGIVDELPYGGTCALRGCDPKKILRRGAEIVDAARLMHDTGIRQRGMSIDWAALMRRKRGFTDDVPKRMEDELARNGVTTFHGHAEFTGENTLAIDGTSHHAERFLIASGATPRPLAFPGAEHLLDSTGFLDLDSLPRRIVFIGGGFISFEFAHIAARAGATCTILDHGARPLRDFDADLVDLLITRSEQSGIRVLRHTGVARIDATPAGFRVSTDSAGASMSIDADLVVHGAGRIPNLDGLNLPAAGVASSEGGVTVAGHLQSTTNPAVYAAGDAADSAGRPLTPVAVFEGKVAASNMLTGAATVPDYTGGTTCTPASPTPATGTPPIASQRRPPRRRSSSTPHPTGSWARTSSAPATANSSTPSGWR